MAYSPVDICNLALSWLAKAALTSLDDKSRAAELCKANYPFAVHAALEEAEWSFATDYGVVEAKQANGRFQLPGDVVSCRACDDGGGTYEIFWELLKDKQVLADCAALHYRATFLVTDPQKFTPNFIRAVAARIGADIALPLTESQKMEQRLETIYAREIKKAASLDSMQGKSRQIKFRSSAALYRR
jgi:hypothetical protein